MKTYLIKYERNGKICFIRTMPYPTEQQAIDAFSNDEEHKDDVIICVDPYLEAMGE